MKRIFILTVMFAACLSIISCSNSSKLEKAAKAQMEATFTEIAKDPSSVKLTNPTTVYCDDSLCIIHVDFAAKNGIGTEVKHRFEYIYINSLGKSYESYQQISDEEGGVFTQPEKYEKNKKGTIYEELSYELGLRYLAIMHVNASGREAGVRDGDSFRIPVPTGTGGWDLKSYKDEFGEESSDKYLVLTGTGVFSNSATTNSEMTAFLFVDKDYDFSFKLIEYNSMVVKSRDSYEFRIKDSEGEIHEMRLYNSRESGQMSAFVIYNSEMRSILEKGGIITVSVKELNNYYTTSDTYLFKMDVDGFQEAMAHL